MNFNRIQLLLIIFAVLLLPFIIYRLMWLHRSVVTKGVVLYINHTVIIRTRQTYPVIQFYTPEKDTLTVTGHYNEPYEEGDSIQLRYIPSNPRNYRVDTFWNCWIEIILWAGFLVLFGSFLLIRDIVPNKQFTITIKGIKQLN
jgi:hypothetical protein